MEGKAYREAGMFMVRHMPLEERINRWPWLLDRRIRRKYFSVTEDEKLMEESQTVFIEETSD